MSDDDFDDDRDFGGGPDFGDWLNEELKSLSEEAIQRYLGTFGDAVESRVQRCLEDARRLCELQLYGPALTTAVTSIELMVRFLLIRPLVSGAFLSEEWEELLAEKIGSGRSDDDRKILPKLLLRWGIDMSAIALSGGAPLWRSLTDKKTGLLEKRNRVVHQGEEAGQPEAILAIGCARTILNDIVYPLASKFGFSLKTTGCWSKIRSERLLTEFKAADPFANAERKSRSA